MSFGKDTDMQSIAYSERRLEEVDTVSLVILMCHFKNIKIVILCDLNILCDLSYMFEYIN